MELLQSEESRDAKFVRMTTAPVRRLVCSFAVASIACMLISAVYNIVDTFFVGKLNTQSTAALGVVFSYMGLIQAVSFYFGQGTGNFISRALGAKKDREAEVMASTGFFLAIMFSSAVALCCAIFIRPVLTFFGATPTVLQYAADYFKWILVGTPFITGSFVLNNLMRFQGNAAVAVYGILSGALLNIVLDPILIFRCGMGVEGAGLATALSQAAGFFLMLFLSGTRGGIRIRFVNFKPTFRSVAEINAGGIPSLARQGLMAVSVVILNNCAGVYGDESLAAFSIVGRVMHLAGSVMVGFGQGFQPVCGFNYGARLYDRLRVALRFCITVGSAYTLAAGLVGFIFAGRVIGIFTSGNPEVIRLGTMVLRAQCAAFPVVGLIIIANMYLQTTKQTAGALILAISRHGLFLIPALIVGALCFGFNGLVAAQPVADLLSFLISVPLLRKGVKVRPK